MAEQDRPLYSGFLRSATRYPERPALEVEGSVLTYEELRSRAASLAATLAKHAPETDPSLTAVFAYRSQTAFAAVLGALLRGHGYVPLNPSFPSQRNRTMLERSGCRALIVDAGCAEQLEPVLSGLEGQRLVILPDVGDVSAWSSRWPEHVVLGSKDLESADAWHERSPDADSIAYLLFTSGSTGTPKGVMVAHRNVTSFVDTMVERYEISETDRFSQTFDLTFDLSAFDMFVAWERGACLCCPTQKALINPGRFIRESELSVWFSVPSSGIFMRRLGALKPGRYPSLRWSLFCGEPLPLEVARTWAEAAPNSVVENLYGPTEATIACMLYRWDPERSPAECHHGVVPIGAPYPGMTALVVDEDLRQVPEGGEGELLMCGPQVSLGYWNDAEKTAAAFVHPPDREGSPSDRAGLHYRTGDRVRRPGPGEPMVYLGRVDHQIKVNGHRVELGEVEAALRDAAGVDAVIALGWPRTESGVGGIVAFVGDEGVDAEGVRSTLAARLPGYMVPRKIHLRSSLPLNANGKFDRNALTRLLEETE